VLRDRRETIDGFGAQLRLMEIETRAAKESGAMACFAEFSNMHASVVGSRGMASVRRSAAPRLAIDESTNFLMGQATAR
jgi:hypothetical protein